MPYLIDGHNLIPNIPGLSLKDIDDEMKLVQRLQRFSTQHKTKIEIFFDQAPPGQSRSQTFGSVTAIFIQQGSTADLAIKGRLASLGASAKNWTVVSSDLEVRKEAESYQARVLSSQDFASSLVRPQVDGDRKSTDKWNPSLSSAEIKYWMDRFGDEDL